MITTSQTIWWNDKNSRSDSTNSNDNDVFILDSSAVMNNNPSSTTSEDTDTTDTDNGGNNAVINNYYDDIYNVTGSSADVVDSSSVSSNDSNTMIINKEGNTYTYSGGYKIISNYQEGEVVRLDSDYQGIDLNGNNFYVKSSSGQLSIQNMRGKVIGYSAGDDNVIAYSYVASVGGNIDGRGRNQTEILIGADHQNNQIFAGSGGSSLWGGNGGADTLTGGDGYDEFFFAMGSGGDVIQNAGSNDIVNLLGVTLDQISNVYVSQEQVHIEFTSGEFLQVKGNTGVGYRLENKTYVCNQSTGEWSTK